MESFPPKLEDLENESDVEQKFMWSLLTLPEPIGLGFSASDIKTKKDIRRIKIGKAENAKLYYPDYLIVMSGLPLVAIEAKSPKEKIDDGLHDARLYASELNALFPAGVNPCRRIIATNGKLLASSPWDTGTIDVHITHDHIDPADIQFDNFVNLNSRKTLQSLADEILLKIKPKNYYRPTSLLGGHSIRNEEIGHNSFGAKIALEYRHLFNPASRAERAYIVKNAYVSSKRREQYAEPIDKFIRAAAPPSVSDTKILQDTGDPEEIIKTLRKRKSLEHQILLIVGGVGAGKSTFVDYLSEVKLPDDVRSSTIWVHTDMNLAPLDKSKIYDWVIEQIVTLLPDALPEIDFYNIEILKKLYSVEIRRLKKGPLALLEEGSSEYNNRLLDKILQLQSDSLATAKAMERYICAERSKLLIIVLDNCDKRNREDQLLMFQVAQWLQEQLHSLIILPIRDVTYDLHRSEPPLDTALKDLVFRIEPPRFTKILSKRVSLALKDMQKNTNVKTLSYTLPNDIQVEYPASDQGMYLTCILRSIFEHDVFVRRTIVGIAGRDMRRAMEIFLEFCTSGHISENEIFKIRKNKGEYILPFHMVTRGLLRGNRRFYDGDYAYLKNVFQCFPKDPLPDNFVRLAILRWLLNRFRIPGPNRVLGYHRCSDLISDLVSYGHNANRIQEEILYLIKGGCIIPEHLRYDSISPEDLIHLSPAGAVHLRLLTNVDYLAACAENIWYDDKNIAESISERIASNRHFTYRTSLLNAKAILDYLGDKKVKGFPQPETLIKPELLEELHDISDSITSVEKAIKKYEDQRQSPIYEGN